jgi:hypothetical protein
MTHRHLAALLIASACGPVVSPADDGTSSDVTTGNNPTTSTSGPSTSSIPPDPSTSPTTAPSTDPSDPSTVSTSGDPTEPTSGSSGPVDPSDTCGDFIGCPDFIGQTECDVWLQDCAKGEKCMPWANDGGVHWNATRCSPIEQNTAMPGGECVVEGSGVSGIDNCELGSMCLFVDPETNTGICVANCLGSEANPFCEYPDDTCSIDFDDTMINCLPACNPVQPECAAGGCYATSDDLFACAPTIGMGAPPGEACEYRWDCAPGTACIGADRVPGCVDASCCAAFCDVTTPEPCGDGLVCDPWYDEGQEPPGLELVGVCVLGEG